jgi:hypothetical protein
MTGASVAEAIESVKKLVAEASRIGDCQADPALCSKHT